MSDNASGGGYGKPPIQGQFKPGQSGNPKGRPRNARSLKNVLKAELDQQVAITENNRTTKVSKFQVVIKRLVERAAKGEPRAISKLIDLVIDMFGIDGESAKPANISLDDQEVVDAFLKRARDEQDDDAPSQNDKPENKDD